MKILIVDDEPDVLLLCRVNLAFDGHEVLEATSASEGVSFAVVHRPDVIVLDMMLPGGDGIGVLGQLQSRSETREIPVIMLTGKARTEDELAGFQAGATLYITKPFSPAALCDAVSKVSSMTEADRKSVRESNVRQLVALQHQI